MERFLNGIVGLVYGGDCLSEGIFLDWSVSFVHFAAFLFISPLFFKHLNELLGDFHNSLLINRLHKKLFKA